MGTKYLDIYILIDDVARYKKNASKIGRKETIKRDIPYWLLKQYHERTLIN